MPDPLRCDCGHLQTDHKSARTGWPHPLKYGICLNDGCDCREFQEAEVPCLTCGGSGSDEGATCPRCQGAGVES